MRNQRFLSFGSLILIGAMAMLSSDRVVMAQEAINTPAATQPGEGNFVNTYKLRFTRYQDTPAGSSGSANEVRLEALLAYGLSGNWSVSVQAPLTVRTVSDEPTLDSDAGLGDLTLQFKHRFWQNDFGPVDTARASVFFGAELPTGNTGLGSESVDPFAGVVLTYISGRHGFNQALSWKLNTGGADDPWRAGDSKHDLLRFDTAYLYRLSPREYGADFVASTYAVVELNGLYETNGDTEVFIAPGLLYEAPTFALELSVSIPVHQSLDHRPEAQYSIGVGVRFLF